jgi:hypothetical protein
MEAQQVVVNGLTRGRLAASDSLLLVVVWLAVEVDAIGTGVAGWLLENGRRIGRAPAQGVVEAVIIAAFFAGLALLVGKLVGPAVATRVGCLVQELQASSGSPTPPGC